ncbi:phosphotransferase family enzyme [Humibacillus xanthopallidus]|uniref:Phosphotransferase family enzyme n=1 Tax=Humibacillus xanthopallidus TaxID=412689 RepID=A0A543PQX0_9MICO|nr:phosphotransferase [Humibacillus xanthopallidus]TQN46454.1 phosphotransferase family enzyme [Humibacillus xanthopallidus]
MSWVDLGQQHHDVTAAVRRLLDDDSAEVGDWATTELAIGAANNPTSGAATRLRGTATTNGTDRAWSLVAKVVRPAPHDIQTPHSVIYWRREADVAASGLLAHGRGLRAPRCVGVVDADPEGVVILFEDIGEVSHVSGYDDEEFAVAAAALGRFQAHYVEGPPLPARAWLTGNLVGRFRNGCLPQLRAVHDVLWERPARRRRFEIALGVDPAPLVAALDDPTPFIEVLESLPQTLCHNDAHVNNLVVRRSADGGWEVWAIDWQMVGTGPLGSDLAQLLVEVAEPDLPRVEAIVLEAYLAALHEDGVGIRREAVEFAYAANVALRHASWVLYLLGLSLDELPRGAPDEDVLTACLPALEHPGLARCVAMLERADDLRHRLGT